MNELLKPYIPMVEFIAKTFGDNCEVILHDLTNVEHSIIAIANSHITGRSVGGHITDFALGTIYNPEFRNSPYLVNYKGNTEDGKKTFKSSTFYIRDESGETIGLFCVNYEITDWLDVKRQVDRLVVLNPLFGEPEPEERTPSQETFSSSMDEMLFSLIDRVISENNVELHRMLMEEKKQVVTQLNNKGVFAMKGAVSIVAKKLEVSEQTIYRYLREISSESR